MNTISADNIVEMLIAGLLLHFVIWIFRLSKLKINNMERVTKISMIAIIFAISGIGVCLLLVLAMYHSLISRDIGFWFIFLMVYVFVYPFICGYLATRSEIKGVVTKIVLIAFQIQFITVLLAAVLFQYLDLFG